MPVTRNALVRYNTIDKCLRNRLRKWTLEDLVDACSNALYEYEGIDKGVSKRTVQMDLQMMRSEKLGYNAPIVVIDKKYYTYEEEDYSITNIPLTDQDLGKLTEVVEILKQFKGFTHFKELSSMVQRLEDKIHTSKTQERSIIDMEKNEHLRGLEYIDPIYNAILNKNCIEITYQSFKARSKNSFLFHPFLLKEHRNRWFVLGDTDKRSNRMLLALDRVEHVEVMSKPLKTFDEEYITNYFNNVVGVTVNEGQAPEEILLLATHDNAPYMITKPLHHSQKVVARRDDGVLLSLYVQTNFELERDILAFGERLKVIAPIRLRNVIRKRLQAAVDEYTIELNERTLKNYPQQLEARGSIITSKVFTNKSINLIIKLINKHREAGKGEHGAVYAIRRLFKEIPELKEVCINSNLKEILKEFDDNLFLTKAIYFDKPPQTNWYVTWHQDLPINVVEKKVVKGYKGWTNKKGVVSVIPPEEILHNTITVRIHLDDADEQNGALKIIPGSHKKVHASRDIKLMTGAPVMCNVNKGGLHIMKPLLLHASSKSINQKRRRVLHLEFNSMDLAKELEWAEREELV
ncbi:MAG: WYL domain-containing protein [Flavipsychrobacter sp.]